LSGTTIAVSPESVRRLAVTKQLLAGEWPVRATRNRILSLVRDLDYLQLDPVALVAPAHILTLWNRLGDFRTTDLDGLLWREKQLFEHWSHAASIVLMEDYPLHYSLMRRYPDSLSKSWGNWRKWARRWLPTHAELRREVLRELRRGPRQLNEFEGHVRNRRREGPWSPGSDVAIMLSQLQLRGEVMVVAHDGNQKVWGLTEDYLPNWVDRRELPQEEVERIGAERSIRALGSATPTEINTYFLRGRFFQLRRVLRRLSDESIIRRVKVEGVADRDERYVHSLDVPLLESMDSDAWRPRASLLSPFDNLLFNRDRIARLFGFDVRFELYVPKNLRKFGPYVLPILWGDRFVGRIGLRLDKENRRLALTSLHAERGAPIAKEVPAELANTVQRLARFLGAEKVACETKVPDGWEQFLH
jgi:uncharacterized protein